MKTVLCADDNQEIIDVVKILAERVGYQVVAATTGKQAMELCVSQKPDMVLMDINLPDMDGIAVTEKLRAAGFKKPVVMLTASESDEDRERALSAGCDDYILKTIDMGDVEIMLSRYLSEQSDFLS
ncbi:MAG: response regulator [Gammaproteobacteria bacterium]